MITLDERTKRILLIAGFGVTVIALGFLIWFIFFRAEKAAPTAEEERVTLPESGALPGRREAEKRAVAPGAVALPVSRIAAGGITETEVLNISGSVAPTIGADGKSAAFLNANDGRFYRIGPDGRVVQMSDKQFFNVEKVHWTPDKNKTIMEFPDGSNVYFDFNQQKQVTLPKHWQDFDFGKTGGDMAALSMGNSPENRWLITSNPDGSGARAIEALGNNADKVTVSYAPNNQTIAFSNTGEPPGGERQSVLLVGKNGENLPALIVDGAGFQPKWTPSGKQLLYSTYHSNDSWKPRIWIANGEGDAIGTGKKDLGLNTWAEKCTFADDSTLYCAVPDTLDEGAGMAPETAKFTPDTLYKIDVRTGSKSIVGKPTGNFSISNLSVDGDNANLIFTDQTTGALHKMRLR